MTSRDICDKMDAKISHFQLSPKITLYEGVYSLIYSVVIFCFEYFVPEMLTIPILV